MLISCRGLNERVSTMDRECLLLLPEVCQVLLESGSSLADDTILEKLLDWFTGLAPAGGSLLKDHPCLLEFISAVIHKTTLEPGVISFVLKLSGLLAANSDAFKILQDCSVLDHAFDCQHWEDAGLWEDPCIRVGWIQGLRNLLQHSTALSFFVQADFIGTLHHLQTDSSLFVASAANQLLAHILLFFQPVTSTGSNGLQAHPKDGTKTRDSPTDTELPVETSQDYSAVFRTISEFIKESLLLTIHSIQFHQTEQKLRFLSMVLGQAGPVLRDLLLQSVTDPLRKLVTAGHSQLTHSLMDVIVAAHSDCGPGGHVCDLLSSMLNVTKPSDLVHAAAAFLHKGKRDSVHTAQAVRILLLPLEAITGQPLLSTSNTEESRRFSMLEELKSKSSCVSILCICLRDTPTITLMPPDVLPSPPDAIVTAVLWLLRISSGDGSTFSSNGCTELFRNVVGSSKVQKCALEALAGFSCSPGVKAEVNRVVPVLIRCLNSPDSEPTVIHKSYQALVKWLRVCEGHSLITDELRRDLTDAVRKRVCDMRWEVRDSTVEFLGKLADVPRSAEPFLDSCSIIVLLREALQDLESYVRASAISALAQTLAHSWQQGAAVTQEQRDIVKQLLEILSQDSEGFARRAVVQYFITWFSSCASNLSSLSSSSSSSSYSPLLMSSVSSVLSLGSSDLDWEVKVHTLELAELLMDEVLSGRPGYRNSPERPPVLQHPYAVVSDQKYTPHTHTQAVESDLSAVLNRLVELGVVWTLLSGLVDCDRPVGLKACQLLIRLRETVCPLSPDKLGNVPATAAVAVVTCELPGRSWGQEVRKLLKTKKTVDVEAATTHVSDSDNGENVCVRLCETLMSLDLETRLEILSQSSDHVYNSPLSLLQDILTCRPGHSHTDAQPGQEVIVDCY